MKAPVLDGRFKATLTPKTVGAASLRATLAATSVFGSSATTAMLRITTSTTVTATSAAVTTGRAAMATVRVKNTVAGGAAVEEVRLLIDDVEVARTILRSGTASLSLPAAEPGSRTVRAEYLGSPTSLPGAATFTAVTRAKP